MADAPLLCVQSLSVRTADSDGGRVLVDDVSFEMGAERIALVGESGSGKSLTARALLGLLPGGLKLDARRLALQGEDLLLATPRQWNSVRGARLSLVMQDPRYSLNPALSVGRQIDAIIRRHQRLAPARRRELIGEALTSVGLTDTRRVLRCYPHELSGGMGQRVMLAMMLVNGPRVLIADEPTSALDASLRDQVLDLMSGLVEARRMGWLLISHDLQQVARCCEHVLVMYRGRIVDRCAAPDLAASTHPYTRTLWSCRPGARTYGTALPTLDRRWDSAVAPQ